MQTNTVLFVAQKSMKWEPPVRWKNGSPTRVEDELSVEHFIPRWPLNPIYIVLTPQMKINSLSFP